MMMALSTSSCRACSAAGNCTGIPAVGSSSVLLPIRSSRLPTARLAPRCSTTTAMADSTCSSSTCIRTCGWGATARSGRTTPPWRRGNGTFVDRAAQLGVEPPTGGDYQEKPIAGRKAARSSRSAAVADFANDGRLEIVTNNFNDRPYFYGNHFPRKNFLEMKLTGTNSNRDAIGAVARLWIGHTVIVRQVSPAGGYLAQSSKTLHFGLDDNKAVDSVVI